MKLTPSSGKHAEHTGKTAAEAITCQAQLTFAPIAGEGPALLFGERAGWNPYGQESAAASRFMAQLSQAFLSGGVASYKRKRKEKRSAEKVLPGELRRRTMSDLYVPL